MQCLVQQVLLTLLIYKLFTIILIMFLIISVKYGHCTLMTSLLSFFWNRFLAICDGESCPDWLILIVVQLQCIVNALRNSAGVHARAPAILRLVTGAARDRIPPAGRRIAIFQSHTHGQSGKYRQLQHLGKPFALVNKTSRNTFLTSVLIGKTPLKALYLKYTQYYTRYFLLTFRNGVALL